MEQPEEMRKMILYIYMIISYNNSYSKNSTNESLQKKEISNIYSSYCNNL